MTVTILTACSDEYWPLHNITIDNRAEYCAKHKYDLLIRRHTPNNHSFWTERESFVLDELARGTDFVLFMGVDTCFTNMTRSVLELPRAQESDVTYGWCLPGVSGIPGLNNDVMLYRNTPATVAFLNRVIELKDQFPNDQAAMSWLLSQESELIKNPLPQKLLNAMPQWIYGYSPEFKNADGIWDGQWTIGDYIFHAPGLPLTVRYELLNWVQNKVVKE